MVLEKVPQFPCPYGQTPTLPILGFWDFWGIAGISGIFPSSRFSVIRHPYFLHPPRILKAHPFTTHIPI